ncbi:PGAP1-like protein-domain-containing protein [Lipomyces kononenkoae]|uniref:PGAP1-like protein-domain-containing protein n=1 Tax=Lipomyces kononenkoae TaxID=34357 RepID=A0ACC3T5W2_LIPKO
MATESPGATNASENRSTPARLNPSKSTQRRLSSQHGSYLTIAVVIFSAFTIASILYSFLTRQLDSKGCREIWLAPSYARIKSFDSSHTRFASKYALYLYREQGYDRLEPNGVPVLFIPGNAGSYKQVRGLAAEAAHQYYDAVAEKGPYGNSGSRNLDFFTADFNEDFTAFHGRTLLDQAEYLNDAIAFILSLYKTSSLSHRSNSDYPLPRSVILIGHSMGGIVARTMLTLPNYRPDSVNTILTLSTPHAVPPATFDWDIVRIYERINKYWRDAYSEMLVGRNPLASVALVSIAGGKLDLIVPSDYASITSLVPSSNGFTVFTSTMPNVWTGADHLAIVWCDQCRKAIIKALLEIVDVREPTQTKYLSTRLQILRNCFLTGLETSAQRRVSYSLVHDTLLKVQDIPNIFVELGRRVVLRGLGRSRQPRAYLIPIPKDGGREDFFSILTDQKLEIDGKDQRVDILLCEQTQENLDIDKGTFSTIIDFSKPDSKSLSFPCTNSAADKVVIPASVKGTLHPHDGSTFSYIQYKLGEISRYDYIALVDSYTASSSGFVFAELINNQTYRYEMEPSFIKRSRSQLRLPSSRSGFVEISARTMASALVSYKLRLKSPSCDGPPEIFAPLVRQFITDPNESKFFPNAEDVDISFYGSSPFVPLTYIPGTANNLKLQMWIDPTCNQPQELSLSVDIIGSLGSLVMRYRTACAALPLAITSIVLLIQFNIYDSEGIFINFGSALEIFIWRALPLLMLASTIFVVILSYSMPTSTLPFLEPEDQFGISGAFTSPVYRYIRYNNMFLGLSDPNMSFLGPLFFTLACGMCIAVYYTVAAVLLCLANVADWIQDLDLARSRHRRRLLNSVWMAKLRERLHGNNNRVASSAKAIVVGTYSALAAFYFSVLSGSRRLLTTFILLISVLAYVPYQFAYVVGFIVHINTCIRALRNKNTLRSHNEQFNPNFVNFAVSILMLMIWVLPINIPVLIVWVHNLSVRWNTAFSSHHNLLSIVPIILLVERMITGKMIPRMTGRFQVVTKILLLYLIIYACLLGILHAYWLHYIMNMFSFWLFIVYLDLGADRVMLGVSFPNYFDGKFDKRP